MSRPSIAPGLVAEVVEGVPSRLKRKLDKNPALAEGWDWSEAGAWLEVRASAEVVVTVRAAGVAVADDLRCACLLAPRCLHRLAVARLLPIAEDLDGEDPEIGDRETGEYDAEDLGRAPGHGSEGTEVTPKERAAAQLALGALEALLGTGLEGAGVRIEGRLLGAVHRCRDAGLHRLSAGLIRLVGHVRARGPQQDPAIPAAQIRDALGLATALHRATVAGVEERGWGRRPYHPIPPVALYGVVSVPFSTEVGYSGVTTFVVSRGGQLSSFSRVVPESSAGLSEKTPLLAGASVTHGDASRHQVLLEGGTRSPDGRLGTGSKVKVVLGASVDWWSEPVADLFAAPFETQLARVFRSRARPPHLRSEGASLLFVDAVSDGEGRLIVDGTAFPLGTRPQATERERSDVGNLGRAAGVRVRVIARAGLRPELVPLAFAAEGRAPWAVGRGGERDLESAWGAAHEVPVARLPSPVSTAAWRPLERVSLGVVRLGWRAVSASRAAGVAREADRLGDAGFKGGDELVRHLIACGARDVSRVRGPDLSAFATAWRAGALYLAHVDTWATERAWGL